MDDDKTAAGDTTAERDWQQALFIPLTILAWLAVIVIALWLVSHVAKTILTLVLSGIVAFALTPLVGLLNRWLPRGLAIAVAYIFGFGVIIGLGAVVVETTASQITSLANNLTTYQTSIQHHEPQILRLLKPFGVTHAKLITAEHQITAYLQSFATTAAKDSIGIISTVVGTVVDIVLVLILSIYLTANGPRITARLRKETPLGQRRHVNLLIAIVNQVVGGYIRGTLTMALLVGALVGLGMGVLQVRYAVLLGILAFFMEFVPVVGVLVSGSVCVIVALFQGWVLALFVLGYFVVVHVIEGDVVGPRIMGSAVGIHPATALIALVAGTELFGFWGALFGAPLAGLMQAIGTAAYREIRGGDPTAVLHAVVEGAKDQVDREVDVPLDERAADETEARSPEPVGPRE